MFATPVRFVAPGEGAREVLAPFRSWLCHGSSDTTGVSMEGVVLHVAKKDLEQNISHHVG